jgi:hypothetical protein
MTWRKPYQLSRLHRGREKQCSAGSIKHSSRTPSCGPSEINLADAFNAAAIAAQGLGKVAVSRR